MPYIRRGYYIVDFLMKEKVPFILAFAATATSVFWMHSTIERVKLG